MGRAERLQSSVREIATQAGSLFTVAKELELHQAMPDVEAIGAAAGNLGNALDQFVEVTGAARFALAERRRIRHSLRNAVHSALGHTEALLDDLETFDAVPLTTPLEVLRIQILDFWDAVDEGRKT